MNTFTNEIIIEFWNREMLTCNKEKIGKCPFSEDTLEFLTKVGLPNIKKVIPHESVNFYNCNNFKMHTLLDEHLIIIGDLDNGFSKLCIRQSTQEFGSVNKNGEYKYINLNVKTFVIFKQIFYSELNNAVNLNTDEIARYRFAEKLRKNFYYIDPKAVENPDTIESLDSMNKAFEQYSYWDSILYFYEEDYLVNKDLEK